MTTLREQRIINIRNQGRRDYHDGMTLAIPAFYQSEEERAAYVAGYEDAKKRHMDDAMDDYNYVGSKHHY